MRAPLTSDHRLTGTFCALVRYRGGCKGRPPGLAAALPRRKECAPGWLPVILQMLALAVCNVSVAQPAPLATNAFVLTNLAQVRTLTPAEADRQYPVRVQAIVTYHDPEWSLLFVQDATAGIYIDVKSPGPPFSSGERVEIEGQTGAGRNTSIVVSSRMASRGMDKLPEAPLVTLERLSTGAEDGQWIEVEGVIQKVAPAGGRLSLDLATPTVRAVVIVLHSAELSVATNWIDAKVRLRGVCSAWVDEQGPYKQLSVYVNHWSDLHIEQPAPTGLESIPLRSLAALHGPSTSSGDAHRWRVQGVVTLVGREKTIAIQDQQSGIWVRVESGDKVSVGDRVEALGFPALEEGKTVLQASLVRRLGAAALPKPIRISARQAATGKYYGRLVQLYARFLDYAQGSGRKTLVCQAGPILFNAELGQGPSPEFLAALVPDLHVRMTGICAVLKSQIGNPHSFALSLRSPADLAVLKWPAWWQLKHFLWLLTGMMTVILLSAAWLVTLNRRVRIQTELIRRQLAESETLKTRYLDLFENANDPIYTHDLAGNLTSFNLAGEKICGYSRAEITQKNIFDLVAPEHRELARQMIARKAAGQDSASYDLDVIAKDGRRVTLEIRSRPIFAQGQPVGVQGMARDVSDRKRAQIRNAVFASLAQKLSGASTALEAARVILEAAQELLGWDACTFDLHSPEQNRNHPILYIDTVRGARAEIPPEQVQIRPDSFSHVVIKEGAKLILRNAPASEAGALVPFGDEARLSASLMFVPIRNGPQTIGVLSIQSYTPRAYDEDGLKTLQALADHCAGALERIRAEHALHESAKLFRALIENNSDGISLINAQGIILYSSPAVTRILGFSVEEDIGSDVFAGIHSEDVKQTRQDWGHLLAQPGRKITVQFRSRHKNGSWRWLEATALNLVSDPSVKAVIVNYRDITERKRGETQSAAFSDLGQKLSLATSLEDAARIVVDIADQLLGWDACYMHLLQSEPRKIISILNFDLIDGQRAPVPGNDPPTGISAMDQCVLEKGAQLILRGESLPAVAELRRFGDKSRPSASLLFVPIRHRGNVVGVLSIQSYTPKAYDQSGMNLLQTLADLCGGAMERIQAEAAVRQTEERFAKAFRASPVAMGISTLNEGRMLDANEAFLSLFQYRREEIIGRTSLQLGLWVDQSARTKLVQALLEHRTVRNELHQFRAKAGEIRQALVSVEVIELRGEPCLIFITHDITERLELEAQLRQAQKMEAVGQLAAGVAHDFNNIMTIILGHASLVLTSPALEANAANSLKEISQAAQRAANLTRQLLTFSRRQVMRCRVLDLNAVVNNVTNMLHRLLGEHISLQFNYSPSLPAVYADEGMIEQIVMNLAVNARDAMPKGGQLIISTLARQIEEQHLRHVPQSRAGRFVCLSVKDTGSGMDAATQSKLFEPFFTTKEVGKGTGLGLATVYGIVQQHQGWIEVASEIARGSTFKVFLPAHGSGAVSIPSEVFAKPEVARGRELILLVEDEPALRSMARRILQHFGYHILEASSSREALQIWRQHGPEIDLLLTDVVMPDGMNGRELADQLQKENKELKVILTSGYSVEVAGPDAALHNGVFFLPKPYELQTLVQAVRKRLDS